TSSSPTVDTPGARCIGEMVPQVASTVRIPGWLGTGRGTMQVAPRRASRSIVCVAIMVSSDGRRGGWGGGREPGSVPGGHAALYADHVDAVPARLAGGEHASVAR